MIFEADDFIRKKITLMTDNFSYLINKYGFNTPDIYFDEYSVRLTYKKNKPVIKIVLLHDLREKYFYFNVTNEDDELNLGNDKKNSKTFIEIFKHYDSKIMESDIQPAFDEKSEVKLKVNAQLLERLGEDILRGKWF